MTTKFQNAGDLLVATAGENDLGARRALLEANATLITVDELKVLDDKGMAQLAAGNTGPALALFRTGDEWSSAANLPRIRLIFLDRIIRVLRQTGPLDAAIDAAERTAIAACTLVEQGQLDQLTHAINASGQAAEMSGQSNDAARGYVVLAEVRRVARNARSNSAELGVLYNFLALTLSFTDPIDWKSAIGYSLEAYRLLSRPRTQSRKGEPPWPDPASFAVIFEKTTLQAYDAQQFDNALILARAWSLVAPDNLQATTELALALMRTQNFTEAETAWRTLVAASPGDPSLLASLAGALAHQKRYDDALAELDRAIQMAPADLHYRRYRADMTRLKGDVAGTIAAISEMIALCDQTIATTPPDPNAPPPEAPQTRIEFERNMTPRDVLDLALVERANLYFKQGEPAKALADFERVATESDPDTAAFAMRERSKIFSARQQPDEALAELRRAVARSPQNVKAILALGAMLVDRQQDIDAINTLTPLTRHPAEAAKVVDLLTPVVQRLPDNRLARIARGFAAELSQRPAIADEDFSAMLAQQPDDAFVLYRRGRVRLMQGSTPADEEWNNALSARRIIDAVSDLARAVALGEQMEDARNLLRGIVDRMCTTHRFHTWFLDDSSAGVQDIFAAFPSLREALQQFLPSLELANRDEYSPALVGWRSIQSVFQSLSMPVSACRIDMYLADTLLRTFDLQGALTHLDRAGGFLDLLYAPMTSAFAADTEERRRAESAARGRPVAVVDAAFQNATTVFDENLLDRVDMLAIDLYGRIGNFDRMLEVLARHPALEQEANPETIMAQSNIAARLRDANLPERALALADRLIAVATDPPDLPRLLNLRGAIRLVLGRNDDANLDFRAAIESAKTADPAFVPLILFNRARLLIVTQRFGEARTQVDEAREHIGSLTPFEEIVLHWLRADIALGLDEVDTAITEIKMAMEGSERTRGSLGASAARIGWEGRLSELSTLAIRIALKAEDPALLFDFVERTRARAYLDVVSSSVAATPDSAREIIEGLQSARARRDVLWQLAESLKRRGPTFVDLELVRALSKVAPQLSVVQRMPTGVQVLSPTQIQSALAAVDAAIANLESRLDAARETAQQAAIGATLDCRAVAAVLQARSPGMTAVPSQEAIVLVQYFRIGDGLCCLTLRSGEDVPILHLIETTISDVAATAAAAPWAAGTDIDKWTALLATLAQPIAERSTKGDLLWIVPCGPLHQVPFHAAVVDGVPLVERNPICHSPSASVGALCLDRARRRYRKAIVFGDTTGDLAFARIESQRVAARFNTRAQVGDEATEEALVDARAQAGDDLDVVHLAAHGTFDADDPLDSGIQMAGGGNQPALLTARDVVRDRLPVELVALSACESGRTHVFDGDEPVGLTRAFLSAGAASVVATLWLVNDLSTRLIVERFYDTLLAPATDADLPWRKAAALQDALAFVRRTTVAELTTHTDATVVEHIRAIAAERNLSDNDTPFDDARYWAAFVLIGAWT
jgi:CHAT domain-containing protein/tetratricopeptide (TPR) repeat protein